MNLLRNNGELQDRWVAKWTHGIMAGVWGCTESVKDYFSLRQKNDELALENHRLAQLVRHYRLITGRDSALDTMSMTAPVGDFSYIPATIIKMSANKQHNYMIISKGSEDGILPLSGIITEHGVIGIVDAVSKNFSYAISFTNSGITISGRIGREGVTGPMSWDGRSSRGAVITDIPLHLVITPGDTVYTSGYSTIFPPDIPLGTVKGAKVVNGSSYEVSVTLFEDFKKLKYITVAHNIRKSEIEELERR